MKYLFGDSTEFNVQRDFLKLLDNFIDTNIKGITLENIVFDSREKIKNKYLFKGSVLTDMDMLLSTIENANADAVSRSKEQDIIVQHAEKSKELVKNYMEESKTKFIDDISQEVDKLEQEITDANKENLEVLESFFIQDPITIIDKKYSIKTTEEGYYALVQTYCDGDISYVFGITTSDTIWNGHIKASSFIKGITIPAKMKKPFLKKEEIPDMINIDDYIVSDLTLSKRELEVVFKKRIYTASERFRLRMNLAEEFSVDIYYAEENGTEKNIQEISELKSTVNISKLRELGEKILYYVDHLYQRRQKLRSIYLSDKDVLEDNIVYELMQKVAEILTPTITDIKEHSPSREEELSIKEEDEHGKRREIYLKRSEIRERLSAIKEKGDKLLEIMTL